MFDHLCRCFQQRTNPSEPRIIRFLLWIVRSFGCVIETPSRDLRYQWVRSFDGGFDHWIVVYGKPCATDTLRMQLAVWPLLEFIFENVAMLTGDDLRLQREQIFGQSEAYYCNQDIFDLRQMCPVVAGHQGRGGYAFRIQRSKERSQRQAMSLSRGNISLYRMFSLKEAGFSNPEPHVERAIRQFLRLGNHDVPDAVAARWIELPEAVLLLQMLPGDQASGTIYFYDRRQQTFYMVSFSGDENHLTVDDFEALLSEYGILQYAERPSLIKLLPDADSHDSLEKPATVGTLSRDLSAMDAHSMLGATGFLCDAGKLAN